jgi:SAM-dependent methyltransferase
MGQFGDLYSKYYDLIYKEKDYNAEVEYIDKLIKKNYKQALEVLDLGCGTGRHAKLFCDKGYRVHGVDFSEEMLEIAETRRKGYEDKLNFTNSNIQELSLKIKYDVVISLFHVISYQTGHDELINTLKVVKNHLKDGGIFLFDFWYGPAVLTDLPSTRVKKLENIDIKFTRIAKSKIYPQKNIVDVNYDIFINDKKENIIVHKYELHKMRYFFDTELEIIFSQIGLKVLDKYEWLSLKSPDFKSWNVLWVIRN